MTIFSAIPFAFKRLWSHRWLALCLLAGLAAAVALAVAVPLYADGINYNLLQAALTKSSAQTGRSPFTFIFRYVGSWHEPIDRQRYTPVDAYMAERLANVLGLPADRMTRYTSTDNLQLYPDIEKINKNRRLDLVKLAVVSDVFEHVTLVDGKLPAVVSEKAFGEQKPIEALASLTLANDLGLEVGATYLLYQPASGTNEAIRIKVIVTGIWMPEEASDSFWFYPPETFDKRLLIPSETFFGPVTGAIPLAINEAAWRFDFDGSRVHGASVSSLLSRITQAQTQVHGLLPNTDLEASPAQALRQYRQSSQSLTGLLFIFSAPVLGLTIYFLGLVAGMLIRRQRNEIAVLRSRGASRRWLVSVYFVEWLLLGIVALGLGLIIGGQLAQLVSRTQSFLDFSRIVDVPIRHTWAVVVAGAFMVALAIVFSLLPAWQAGRYTVVSYKQERARQLQSPLWQRIYLDVILMVPALYGIYTLRAEGKLRLMGRTLGTSNPFENPLLFLLPTLFIISLSLLLLRFLPRLLSFLAWFAARFPFTVPLMALRQLARSAGSYLGPLLLMVITLSMAGFVSSMAQTLDNYLKDNAYYEAGADLNLAESGEYTGERPTAPRQPGAPRPTPPPSNNGQAAVWNFLPVSDHLALPGVEAAARVGRYEAEFEAGGRRAGGQLVGIDRTDFPFVAFFRNDFASEPFIGLLNRLAFDPSALIVDRATWDKFHLNTGDSVQITVDMQGEKTISFKVAGVATYFPTLYPEEGPFFIGNLEYIFESAGGLQPYDVWLRTTPGSDTDAIITGINDLGIAVVAYQDARTALEEAFGAPNRQGMLGMLSVGFLAASILTILGFLLYAMFSFQERFVQLGVMRAVGLGRRQMAAALALEQFLLILVGLAGGTGIAVLTAYLFIPHLPVAIGLHPGTPPYVVAIAWGDITRVYIIFGVMLFTGITLTLISLSRMKIFQAVKLGEIV
ncbi:MAG: ABC transporter permease [Chloroflexota bacterium]